MSGEKTLDPGVVSQHHFHIGDYVVFGLTIFVAIGIGIFYAVLGRRKNSTAEYLVGGRSMNFIPTAISLMVSFESSILMLGMPAEAYVYGIQIVWTQLGFFISNLLAVKIAVPLFHPLRITSAYEYLEMRFQSRAVRLMGTMFGILSYTWYMGIVLFGPAVALEAVTGYPLWNSIVVIAIVSVIYTAMGGMKAVIWTDVFQSFVMYLGIFSILIKGTIDAGGAKKVWDIAYSGGRMNFFNFRFDPRVRHTFWNLLVCTIIRGFGIAFNQSTVQRISSTRSMGDAKRMFLLMAPFFFLTGSMAIYEGVVTYSYYQTKACDPLASNQITNPNQLIPFIVMDIFAKIPGMPGLFLASLFSASLSTLSSGMSSLAALTWTDIIHPLLGDVSEVKATIIIKLSVVFFGGVACAVSFLVSQIGGTLMQIAGSLISAFAAPLSGLFFLGCFFPRCTAKGCLIGGVSAFILTVWLSMGINFSPVVKKTPWLPPASTEKCYLGTYNNSDVTAIPHFLPRNNYSSTETPTEMFWTTESGTPADVREPEGIENIYTISYQWIILVGFTSTILIALIASFCTGMNKPGDVDPRYLISLSDTFLLFLPKSVRSYISSIGPQFMKEKYKARFEDPSKKHLNITDMDTEIAVIAEKPVAKSNGNIWEKNGQSDSLLH